MGNTASALMSQVSGLNDSELTKTSREDAEMALVMDQINDSEYIQSLKGLSQYELQGWQTGQAASKQQNLEEVKYAFSQDTPSRVYEKYNDLKLALLDLIKGTIQSDSDPLNQDLRLKLQTICRVQHALLRQEERERRRVESNNKPAQKQQKKKKEMPLPAKIGLKFGLETLLNMVRVVGSQNPEIFMSLVGTVNGILMELQPLVLNEVDPSIESSLDQVSDFLQQALSGRLTGCQQPVKSFLAPIFGISLVRGDLSTTLDVVDNLLKLPASEDMNEFLGSVSGLLKDLEKMESKTGQKLTFNWNSNKLGPDIALSNENLTVTRTDSSGWGCQLSEQSITQGIHYIEFKIDRNGSTCLLLGLASSEFSNYSSKSSGAHCYTLQSDGDAYMNERGCGNVFRYTERDSVGLLVNMEEKTLTFFHNGRKQTRQPFGPLPDEVYLIACFGGSNQFVTIVNDPEIPDEAGELMNVFVVSSREEEKKQEEQEEEYKEGEEVELFQTAPNAIVNDWHFKSIRQEDQGHISPQVLAVYIMVCLNKLNDGFFAPFKLSEKPTFDEIKAKLPKKQGLAVDIQPKLFQGLSRLLDFCIDQFNRQAWDVIDFPLTAWTAITTLRLLRSHIFSVLFLKLKEEETGLHVDFTTHIYNQLQELLKLEISNFGRPEVTKEDIDAVTIVKREVSLTLIRGFEAFHPNEITQLNYMIESLEDTLAERRIHDIHANLQNLLLEKLSVPVNLVPAFSSDSPETLDKLESLLQLLLKICSKQAKERIQGQGLNNSKHYLDLLGCAQKVLLNKAAITNFAGKWHQILLSYFSSLLSTSNELLQHILSFEDDRACLGDGTILESIVTTILLTLSLAMFNLEEATHILQPLLTLQSNLGKCLARYQINQRTEVTEIYESPHPCKGDMKYQHVIRIKGAKKYRIEFLRQEQAEQTNMEIYSDVEQQKLVQRIDNLQLAAGVLEVESPVVVFQTTSKSSQDYWGWHIRVTAQVDPKTFANGLWLRNLSIAADYLQIVLSRLLITGVYKNAQEEEQFNLVVNNRLFKYGIHSKCVHAMHQRILQLNPALVQLTQHEEQAAEEKTYMARSLSSEKMMTESEGELGGYALEDYVSNFEGYAKTYVQYSEYPVLEEFIKGSDRVTTCWTNMKNAAGIVGPTSSIGGQAFDILERAVFGIFAQYLEFANTLSSILESGGQDFDPELNQFIQIAVSVRKWAQYKKQTLLDKGEDITYDHIIQEVLQKCIILLHTEYKPALTEIGISKIQSRLASVLRKEPSQDGKRHWSRRGRSNLASKWRMLVRLVGTKGGEQQEDEAKKEVQRLRDLVFEFFDANMSAVQFVEYLEYMNNKALGRAIGLNLLLQMIHRSEDQNTVGKVAQAFSQAFMGQQGKKQHYFNGMAGVDYALQKCTARSFFQLYEQLLKQVNMEENKYDITELEGNFTLLKILEALSFPFNQIDFPHLLDLKIHEPLRVLIQWIKGQSHIEKPKYNFNITRCITQIKVLPEENLEASENERFSLSINNRLQAQEGVERPEGALCMELIRGGEFKPIIACYTGQESPENYLEIGNINEAGDPVKFFVRRGKPKPNRQYLTGITVNSENPIQLDFQFTSYENLLEMGFDQCNLEAKGERRLRLRQASWNLFKLLMYICTGNPLDSSVMIDEVKKTTIQKIFSDLLLQEIKWIKGKERVGGSDKDLSQLKLKKISTGELWLHFVINNIRLHRNVVEYWIRNVQDWMASLQDSVLADNIKDALSFWMKLDPALQGEFSEELVFEEGSPFENARNSRNNIDFFKYIRHCLQMISEAFPDTMNLLDSCPMLVDPPQDMRDAHERYDITNMHQLIEELQKRLPNAVELNKLLAVFLSQSEEGRLGIVKKDNLAESYPAKFFNEQGELDLLHILHQIKLHSFEFPVISAEIQPLVSDISQYPVSCDDIYSPIGTNSVSLMFTSSILWTIYQCCGSKSFLRVISHPEFVQELLKHMFMGANEECILLASRILRKVLPAMHNLGSLRAIWAELPIQHLDKYIFEENTQDPLRCLFVLAGYRHTYHMNFFKDFTPGLIKMTTWSAESEEMLRVLASNDNWKADIHRYIEDSLTDLPSIIQTNNLTSKLEMAIGVLGFMAYNSPHGDPVDKVVQKWQFATFKGGSIPQGYIMHIWTKNRKVAVYSEEDDGFHTESLNNIQEIKSTYKFFYYNALSQQQTQMYFELLSRALGELATGLQLTEAQLRLSSFTLQSQIKILIYRILNALYNNSIMVGEEEANMLVQNLFAQVRSEEIPDLSEDSVKYRYIRILIYNKFKQFQLEKLKDNQESEQMIEILEDEQPDDEIKFINQEEENRIISAMPEDQQLLVVMCQSVGLSFRIIQEGMRQGLSDAEEIQKWASERKQQEEIKQQVPEASSNTNKCIFSLKKSDEGFSVVDNSGIAHFGETKIGHLRISAKQHVDEQKMIYKNFDSQIFRTFNEFVSELTFLVAFGFSSPHHCGQIGLVLGELQVLLIKSETEASLIVDGNAYSIPISQSVILRIITDANSHTTIQPETPGAFEIFTHANIFNGIQIGKYGVFLDHGQSAELKGLSVYQGRFMQNIPFWSEELEEDSENNTEAERRRLNVGIVDPNLTYLRLLVTGAPKQTCEEITKRHAKFEDALEELLMEHHQEEWDERCEVQMDSTIVDINLIEDLNDMDDTQELVPMFTQSGDVLTDYHLENRRFLVQRKHRSVTMPGNYITQIFIANEIADATLVGDLTINTEHEESNKLFIQKISKDKLGSRSPLSGLLLVACQDYTNVLLPPGYSILKHENMAVNIGGLGDGQYVFIAYKTQSELLGIPVTPIVHSKMNITDHGLVDIIETGNIEKNLEKFNKLEEEITGYQQKSLVELHSHLNEIESHEFSHALRQYLLHIIRLHPYTLCNLLTNKPEALTILTNIMKDNIKTLENAIISVLKQDHTSILGYCLYKEVLLQLILASTSVGRQEKLPEMLVESAHPYENNMRHNETITIPGAAGLRIEFDAQCHTESGCDILRLYRQPSHVDQICEYSGRSFPDLEISGDTVYLYFFTDSSCVEWGYKFRVIPIEGSMLNNKKDPLLQRLNIKSSLWVLEQIVMQFQSLPLSLARFVGREFIHALTVFIHSTSEPEQQERTLRILKFLLKIQVERQEIVEISDMSPSVQGIRNVLELFVYETRCLYNYERTNRGTSSLLQKLVSVIAELKDQYQLELDEKWFIEYCDSFSLMKGFCNRDHNMYPILFEQFRKARKIEVEAVRESSHPYTKRPGTKELYISGAKYIDIEFDEQSKLDIGDCIYFSYDEEGLQPVEVVDSLSISDACWCSEPKGPDIAFSNGNMSITRTNSSGWGSAIWSEQYSTGKVKITFKIDNDGRSDYLYIGIFKATGNYSLNNVTNMDYSQDLWMWKTTGEFHKRGEKQTEGDARYRSNDIIALAIDMDDRTMTCFKNDNQVYVFREIAEEVIPAICFGGSNQHVSIVSVETLNPITTKLSKKKLCINGDRVFYHFPVNIGYMFLGIQKWKKPNSLPPAIVLSSDSTRIKRIAGMDTGHIHKTSVIMSKARFYCELFIRKLDDSQENPAQLQFGLINEGFDMQQTSLQDSTWCYQSNGLVLTNQNRRNVSNFQQGDIIGIYIDFHQQIIVVYKNGSPCFQSEDVTIDQAANYCIAVRLDREGQEVEIVKTPNVPRELDLMGIHKDVSATKAAGEWGYRFKATPVFQGEQKLKILECLTEEQTRSWESFVQKHTVQITKQCEEQLVQFIDDYCSSKGVDPLEVNPNDVEFTSEQLIHYNLLENFEVEDARDTLRIIQFFNQQIKKILHLVSVDLSYRAVEGVDELQKLFLKTRGYIFGQLKRDFFTKVLDKSKTESKPDITIDRTKAMRQKNLGKVDSQCMTSVFGQVFRAINHLSHSSLRNPERIFKANFLGEGSTDAGGPYNEVISTICDELQSRYLPLLVPTQNNIHNVGEFRDAYIINTGSDTPQHLEYFTFLGKLMGVAIRTQNNLNLTFPPLFWKRLVMEDVDEGDLRQLDELTYQMIQIFKNLSSNDITADNFSSTFENIMFSAPDSSGRIVSLIDGGSEIPVQFDTAGNYADLLQQMRLNEAVEQYSAIRKGMSTVVPLNLLNMFSWKQVESMVCGAQDIDVDLLMTKTTYENVSKDSPHIQLFWEVLREMTPLDRSLFLRFVWGRTRLPSGRKFKNFKITAMNKGGNPDQYLPIAHTCFFQLDLPTYTNKEIMRNKLMYAITHCQAIDLDRVAQGGWAEDDDD